MASDLHFDGLEIQFGDGPLPNLAFVCVRSGGDVFGYYQDKIDDLFQKSSLRDTVHQGFLRRDDVVAFCVAKDLIQDTHDSLHAIRQLKWPVPNVQNYIHFWGILQAIFIQQDALCEMHRAITGVGLRDAHPRIKSLSWQHEDWRAIRETRHMLAGHPVHKGIGSKKTRVSIARGFLSPTKAYIERYDCRSELIEHEFIDLKPLIARYERTANTALFIIYRAMRAIWKGRERKLHSA